MKRRAMMAASIVLASAPIQPIESEAHRADSDDGDLAREGVAETTALEPSMGDVSAIAVAPFTDVVDVDMGVVDAEKDSTLSVVDMSLCAEPRDNGEGSALYTVLGFTYRKPFLPVHGALLCT